MAKKIMKNSMDIGSDIADIQKGIQSLCSSINKKISEVGGSAHVLSDDDASTNIKIYVSSGSTILDTILANKYVGGFPVGKVIEVFGPPSSGKSLISAHSLYHTQKMGGVAILIDTEAATNPEFLESLGVDLTKLIWIQIPNVETIFETIESLVTEAVEKIKPPFITVVWDSVAGASDLAEMEGDYEQSGYGMAKAKAMSKGFRKITNFLSKNNVLLLCTNQIRDNLNAAYGAPPQKSPGGWALEFYSSVRCEVKKVSPIKLKKNIAGKEVEEVIGITIRVKTPKSRIAPPHRECILNVYFSRGIDDKDSWFDGLLQKEVITKLPNSKSYFLKLEDGREFTFQKADWKKTVKENNLLAAVKDLVIKSHIITYEKFDDSEWENIEENIELNNMKIEEVKIEEKKSKKKEIEKEVVNEGEAINYLKDN